MSPTAATGVPEGVRQLFVTPIVIKRWPRAAETNPALARAVRAAMAASPGNALSNLGGWQSTDDFLAGADPAVQAFRGWVIEAFGAVTQLAGSEGRLTGALSCTMAGWANVNEPDDVNLLHVHGSAHWSGVYYVETGHCPPGDARSGALIFQDPRPAAGVVPTPGFAFGEPAFVTPEPGLTVLFPGWLPHGVLPRKGGSGQRISIAFNITMTPQR